MKYTGPITDELLLEWIKNLPPETEIIPGENSRSFQYRLPGDDVWRCLAAGPKEQPVLEPVQPKSTDEWIFEEIKKLPSDAKTTIAEDGKSFQWWSTKKEEGGYVRKKEERKTMSLSAPALGLAGSSML